METLIENELLPIVSETSLTDSTKEMLLDRFTPFLEQVREWKQKAESLIVTDVTQIAEMKMARAARLAIKQIRVEADKTRKELKEDSLRYGKAVQSVYNIIESAITPIESHLEYQEKFKERKEAEEKAIIKSQREDLASPYREFIPYGIDFGEITETDFQNLLNGGKMQLKAKEDAIAQAAEAERIRKEKEAEERERLRVENERLKVEAEKREKAHRAERERLENEKRIADTKAAEERKAAEAEAEKRKAELAILESELKAKNDAEDKAEADRQAAIEAELSMGDSGKMQDLLYTLSSLKTKYEFKSKKHKTIYLSVNELIDKTILYVNSKL